MAITLSYPQGCALVVGGTGQVGEGVVRRLAQADVPVVFTYFGKEEKASRIEGDLRGEGLQVWRRRMDMRDTASIDSAIAFSTETAGRLHSVLCAGGPTVPFNRIADFTPEQVENFVLGDALGCYRLFNRAIPVLRAAGGGSLTVCSTIALKRVIDFDGISPLSKGSLEALVRQVAAEEAHNSIRCNAVAIGCVVEDHLLSIMANLPPMTSGGNPATNEEMLIALLHQINGMMRIKRPANQDEAGNLFAFLASDQASYVNGQIIAIDGGAAL